MGMDGNDYLWGIVQRKIVVTNKFAISQWGDYIYISCQWAPYFMSLKRGEYLFHADGHQLIFSDQMSNFMSQITGSFPHV